MEHKLLIVEDDPLMQEAVSDYFVSKGWLVQTADTGADALGLMSQDCFQLVLLDVMMPGMDGFAVCRKIREDSDIPIIFITARAMEEDGLNGYALGADDYVTKPFSLPILHAKAEALLKRCQGKDPHAGQYLHAGSLKIDLSTHEIWIRDQKSSLPPKEYEILLFFLENPGRIFSRDQLLIRFWGYDFDGNERVVDNHIKKLRKAIGGCGCTIHTVRKFGYRMEVER